MKNSGPLTGIILAGGEGSRMGGEDKGWIKLRGKPLVEWVLERLQPQVDGIIVSANRNLERYQALKVPVVHDATVYLGPLAGIATALENMTTDYGLVVPTDAPLIPTDLAAQLLPYCLSQNPTRLVICHDGERLQPLFGLYHRSLATSIREFLASDQRQLTRWCLEQNPEIVTIGDTQIFTNLNTTDELARIETILTNQNE